MVKIQIGSEERDLASADELWINQQINRRRADRHAICVRVTIQEGEFDMILSTPACAASRSRRRPPRTCEQEVFDLWEQRGLNDADFSGGNLVAFLRQLRHLL